jgi:hypothetical protein
MSTAQPIHDDQNADQSDQSHDDIKPVRGRNWPQTPALNGDAAPFRPALSVFS